MSCHDLIAFWPPEAYLTLASQVSFASEALCSLLTSDACPLQGRRVPVHRAYLIQRASGGYLNLYV
jgi:hypothetical protein